MNSFESFLKIDNLYKFISILGVILLLTPSILSNRLEKLQIEALKLQLANELVKDETKNLRSKMQTLDENFTEFENKMKVSYIELYKLYREKYKLLGEQKENISLEEKNLLKNKLSNINKEINFIMQKSSKYINDVDYYYSMSTKYCKDIVEKEKIAKRNLYKAKATEIKLNTYKKESLKESFIKRIGLFLILLGIFLWYFKIQIYVDREIKKQSKYQNN